MINVMPSSQPQDRIQASKGSFYTRRIQKKWRIAVVLVVLIIAIPLGWVMIANPFGIKDVKVVVEYPHHWTGNFGELDVIHPLNETGNYTHLMHKMFDGKWNVFIMAQKQDNSTDILRVSIETLDGKVLKSVSTIQPYEMVLVEVIL